ncbi:MAG: flagellar basal body-associated FliL family protein [Desulfobacteraceae bacterium]|nr:flagellar basal body-associated FliL family protein [Desulfobacteraceae bacterium]
MAEADEKEEKPKSSKKLLLIIVVLFVVLAGGGAGAYFMFLKGPAKEKAAEAPKGAEQAVIQDMETFLVNLADQGGKRFLKLTMKAKVSSLPASEEFKSRHFEMRDMILMILTGKEAEELTRAEDKLSLKKEIVGTLNKALQKGQVLDVYFTEFLIQ